MIGNLIS